MKRNLQFILALSLSLVMLTSSLSFAARKLSEALNPHNLSSSASHTGPHSDTEDQICVFCHTPHSAAPDTPLWNRPDPNTMGSFPLYNSALLIKGDTARTGYIADANYPSGASRMCLSCHDGATAIGILLGSDTISMPGGSEFITKTSAVIQLDKAHPISFNYNNDVIVNVLNASYQLPADPSIDTPLDNNGQMQCTTCHDPHLDTRADASYDNLPFWRHLGAAASYDDVCQSCHVGATPATAPHLP